VPAQFEGGRHRPRAGVLQPRFDGFRTRCDEGGCFIGVKPRFDPGLQRGGAWRLAVVEPPGPNNKNMVRRVNKYEEVQQHLQQHRYRIDRPALFQRVRAAQGSGRHLRRGDPAVGGGVDPQPAAIFAMSPMLYRRICWPYWPKVMQ
jgi:hypothetical protein